MRNGCFRIGKQPSLHFLEILHFQHFARSRLQDLHLRVTLADRLGEPRAGIIITGLPHVGPINGGLKPFFSLQDLANLTPGAGGDKDSTNNGPLTLQQLLDLEPAAGGDDNGPQKVSVINGACWGAVGGA